VLSPFYALLEATPANALYHLTGLAPTPQEGVQRAVGLSEQPRRQPARQHLVRVG